jgi:hypothetical protein
MQTEHVMPALAVLPVDTTVDTLGYPTNRLISVIDDWKCLNRAVLTLVGSGIDPNAIEVLYGTAGIQRLRIDRAADGLLGRLRQRLPELGPERALMSAYQRELRAGHALLVLRQPNRAPQSSVVQTLTANGGHLTRFFGRFAVHTLTP